MLDEKVMEELNSVPELSATLSISFGIISHVPFKPRRSFLTCSPSELRRVFTDARIVAMVGKDGPVEYINPLA